MIFDRLYSAAMALALAAGVTATPAAALVHVAGQGIWNPTTISTAHINPESTFSYSFDLPNVLPPSLGGFGYTTNAFSNFSFLLDGTPVAEALIDVVFYTSPSGGLFDLDFASETLSLFGADVGGDGTLVRGFYVADYGYAGHGGEGAGFVALTAVPEPAAWALMLAGFGVVGVAARRRAAITA